MNIFKSIFAVSILTLSLNGFIFATEQQVIEGARLDIMYSGAKNYALIVAKPNCPETCDNILLKVMSNVLGEDWQNRPLTELLQEINTYNGKRADILYDVKTKQVKSIRLLAP